MAWCKHMHSLLPGAGFPSGDDDQAIPEGCSVTVATFSGNTLEPGSMETAEALGFKENVLVETKVALQISYIIGRERRTESAKLAKGSRGTILTVSDDDKAEARYKLLERVFPSFSPRPHGLWGIPFLNCLGITSMAVASMRGVLRHAS